MKKYVLTIVLIVIMSVAVISFFIVGYKYKSEKSINSNIKQESKRLTTETKKSKEEIERISKEIEELKESSKEKVEEQEIWLKAKEKLTQAL